MYATTHWPTGRQCGKPAAALLPSRGTTGHSVSLATEQGTPGIWHVSPQSTSQGGQACAGAEKEATASACLPAMSAIPANRGYAQRNEFPKAGCMGRSLLMTLHCEATAARTWVHRVPNPAVDVLVVLVNPGSQGSCTGPSEHRHLPVCCLMRMPLQGCSVLWLLITAWYCCFAQLPARDKTHPHLQVAMTACAHW